MPRLNKRRLRVANRKKNTDGLKFKNNNDLLRVIPEVLNSIPITTIRKFARKSWRYMDAYDKGLERRMAEWTVKKYKLHRRLPTNFLINRQKQLFSWFSINQIR